VRWGVAGNVLIAWVLAMPLSAAIAFGLQSCSSASSADALQ
jgi:phosphate/sulfate permease